LDANATAAIAVYNAIRELAPSMRRGDSSRLFDDGLLRMGK
jgi:hypothetical protein